jgi:hypothetical protein
MDTASDVRWIQEDLGHYFARTKTETFKEILDEMRESQIDIGLEEVRTGLRRTIRYKPPSRRKSGRTSSTSGRRSSKARNNDGGR